MVVDRESRTIGALARAFGLSRSALLYYDRIGLLRPSGRSSSGYRLYSPADRSRLERICSYRQLGVPLEDIGALLDAAPGGSPAAMLRRRLAALEEDIRRLRSQQTGILAILNQSPMQEEEMIDKKRWTEIMEAAGMDDQDMRRWHIQFEKMEPQAHQEFLESLAIEPEEIKEIRAWSAEG